MLSEFGKFPALEKNWKPTDFNKTKVLIWSEKEKFDYTRIFKLNLIEDTLHFDLGLSRDLIADILEDFKQFTDSNKFEDTINPLNETTIRYVYYDL